MDACVADENRPHEAGAAALQCQRRGLIRRVDCHQRRPITSGPPVRNLTRSCRVPHKKESSCTPSNRWPRQHSRCPLALAAIPAPGAPVPATLSSWLPRVEQLARACRWYGRYAYSRLLGHGLDANTAAHRRRGQRALIDHDRPLAPHSSNLAYRGNWRRSTGGWSWPLARVTPSRAYRAMS